MHGVSWITMFINRYKSIVCDKDTYLLCCSGFTFPDALLFSARACAPLRPKELLNLEQTTSYFSLYFVGLYLI
jgi:hypothetical protein